MSSNHAQAIVYHVGLLVPFPPQGHTCKAYSLACPFPGYSAPLNGYSDDCLSLLLIASLITFRWSPRKPGDSLSWLLALIVWPFSLSIDCSHCWPIALILDSHLTTIFQDSLSSRLFANTLYHSCDYCPCFHSLTIAPCFPIRLKDISFLHMALLRFWPLLLLQSFSQSSSPSWQIMHLFQHLRLWPNITQYTSLFLHTLIQQLLQRHLHFQDTLLQL